MENRFIQFSFLVALILSGAMESEARPQCKQAYQRAAKSCGVKIQQFDANSFYQGVSASDVRAAEKIRDKIESIYGACLTDASMCNESCKREPAAAGSHAYRECTQTRFQSQLFANVHRLDEDADRAAQLVQGASGRYKAQAVGEMLPAPRMNSVAFRRGPFKFGSYTVYQRDPRNSRMVNGGEYVPHTYTGVVANFNFGNIRNWFRFKPRRAAVD